MESIKRRKSLIIIYVVILLILFLIARNAFILKEAKTNYKEDVVSAFSVYKLAVQDIVIKNAGSDSGYKIYSVAILCDDFTMIKDEDKITLYKKLDGIRIRGKYDNIIVPLEIKS